MHRHVTTLTAAILGAGVTAALLLPSRSVAPEPKLPPASYLPELARGILQKRMDRHAATMNALSLSVILLDFKAAERAAEQVASEPTLARPTTQDATELNALLPAHFFELQDALQSAARKLVVAARSEDTEALATAHAELTHACVACHGTYLKGGAHAPPTMDGGLPAK